MNRRRPKPGEDLALFLSGVINDAIKDAVDAGLLRSEAVRIAHSLAMSWQTNGSRCVRHPAPCVGYVVGTLNRASCIYLCDGSKARIRCNGQAAWLEVVPQDVLTPVGIKYDDRS